VPRYWLLDPDQQSLEAYELVRGQYQLVVKVQNADLFAPSLFLGLSIQLADLWV
jgi:Uma2 family endonuclease